MSPLRLLLVMLGISHQCLSLPSSICGPVVYTPQVVIVSMWAPEAQVWFHRFHESNLGNLTAVSVAVPGLSMLYPRVHCTEGGLICLLTTGEGEINAAASMIAFALSKKFNLRSTYFLLAGIAGVNPHYATIGSVALSRYAIQVALQYEIDPRSLPHDWPTGYIAYGRAYPFEYPTITYGTEVFELNAKLRDVAFDLAAKANLSDQEGPRQYRSKYSGMPYHNGLASKQPTVVKCDSATSDVYYSGTKLSDTFENITKIWTNGTGVYCMSAQEENATLEALVRGAIDDRVDFSRVMVMRAGSNFDRPPPGRSDWQHLTDTDQNGFAIAIDNIYNTGIEIIKGIVSGWNTLFKAGIVPENYIGDIFGSLGGEPDFGFGSITHGRRANLGDEGSDLAAVEMQRRERFGSIAIWPIQSGIEVKSPD